MADTSTHHRVVRRFVNIFKALLGLILLVLEILKRFKEF